jgi:hypothetical protein
VQVLPGGKGVKTPDYSGYEFTMKTPGYSGYEFTMKTPVEVTMEYTATQIAGFGQSFKEYVLDTHFERAIQKDLAAGRSPKEIAADFLDIAAVYPGHRAEFARRIEHAAIWIQGGWEL